MAKTWILIAHRAGARIVSHAGPGHGLSLLEEIAHPEGRLRPHEIEADAPGRVHDRMGSHRHGVATEESATEHVARVFAKSLAERLRHGAETAQYEQLVLIAGPKLLGKLRDALDNGTAAHVIATVDRDLRDVSLADLPAHLAGVIRL